MWLRLNVQCTSACDPRNSESWHLPQLHILYTLDTLSFQAALHFPRHFLPRQYLPVHRRRPLRHVLFASGYDSASISLSPAYCYLHCPFIASSPIFVLRIFRVSKPATHPPPPVPPVSPLHGRQRTFSESLAAIRPPSMGVHPT